MRFFRATFMVVVLILGSCKQKAETTKPQVQEPIEEVQVVKPLSKTIKELVEFAGISLTDSTDINEVFEFKQLDKYDAISAVQMNQAVNLYKKMMKREQEHAWPIFEIKNTDNVILPVKGIGFGGPIWAKVMVDRKELEIKKIEFGHGAESEGYGAPMTLSSFEKQFVGTKINLDKNTFGLQNHIEKRIDAGRIVDGISGATGTSEGVVEMVNLGMQKYSAYFKED